MHAGLSRILDLIRVNPQDTLLVDRFLILAADLHEEERVDVTLSLSEALLRKNPRRSIELAHMVYKARPGDTQPLELMVECLENLGRYGKATVLRQHLEKVRNAKDTNPGLAQRVVDESVAAIDRELLLFAEPKAQHKPFKRVESPAPGNPEQHASGSAVNITLQVGAKTTFDAPKVKDVMAEAIKFSIANPESYSQDLSLNRVFPSDLLPVSLGIAPNEPASFPLALDQPENEQTAPRDLQSLNLANPQQYKDVLDPFYHASSEEMIAASLVKSQIIKPNLKESLSKPQGVPSLMVPIEELEDNFEHVDSDTTKFAVDEGLRAVSLDLEQLESFAVSPEVPSSEMGKREIQNEGGMDPVDFVQRCAKIGDWEAAWQTIEKNWAAGSRGAIMNLAKGLHLEQVDIRFLAWWLDCLLADRRPRQAFALAVNHLRDHPYMSIANVLFPRLQRCAKVLGWRTIVWQHQDGVLALLQRLKEDALATAASLAILDVDRSAS